MRFLLFILVFIAFPVYAESFSSSLSITPTPTINYRVKEKLYSWKVNRVIDGDTIEIIIPSFPEELNPVKIRVRGINTPEKSKVNAKCENEIILAKQATEFTKTIIFKAIDEDRSIKFSQLSWDKYGGRIVANVHIGGKTQLSELLIKNGLAKPYDGSRKSSWCN